VQTSVSSSHEHTRCTAQQSSSADRKHELFILKVPADQLKHFFVVHECLLSITTGHHQNIKEFCFRYVHIRRKSKPLHVAHLRNSLSR
jgi:hypothetical protein